MSSSPRPPQADASDAELSIRDVWNVLLRNRWRVLLVALATVVLGAAYVWTQDPVYESGATLQIDTEASGFSLLTELSPLAGAAGAAGGASIETELLVLQSRRIAEQVVDSLDLHVVLLEPALPRTEMLTVLQAPRAVLTRTYRFEYRDDGAYAVSATEPRRDPVEVGTARLGEPVRLDSLILVLSADLRLDPPAELVVRVRPFRSAVEDFQRTVQASRPSREVQIVTVGYRHRDPVLTAAAANATAQLYIRHRSRASKGETRGTIEFLREQVAVYETQLRSAEAQLRAYREQAQVISPKEEATEQVRRLAELQAQRDALQADRDALAKLLTDIRQQPPTTQGGQSPYRQLAAFPIFLANPAVQNMLQSITELENERAQLLVRRTPDNVDVRGIDRRIAEIEMQLYQTATSYLESLNSQIASADANLGRFGNQLEQIPARELEFSRLLREQSLLAELYTLLQTRLKDAEIREAVTPLDVQILDPALVPEEPVSPRPLRTLLLALLVGLVLGTGFAFARETMDTKIRTEADARAVGGGVAVLGLIPRGGSRSVAMRRLRGRERVVVAAPNAFLGRDLVARTAPTSVPAEAYRTLRTNLTFASLDAPPRAIVVTSASEGDGKSTTAANLAVILAQQGARTLLVDADLRRGGLHEVLGTSREPGLTHVLADQASLDAAVRPVEVGPGGEVLHFLPAGAFPPDPTRLLGSERMRKLLAELRERYDTVILDTPPLTVVTDAALVGRSVDTTLVVARAGVTEKEALQRTLAQLRHVQAPVGGLVLNDAEMDGGGEYAYASATDAVSGNGRGASQS